MSNPHSALATRPTDRRPTDGTASNSERLPSNRGPLCSLPHSSLPLEAAPTVTTQQTPGNPPRPESAPGYLPTSVCVECRATYELDTAGSLCPECRPAEQRAYERHGRQRGKTADRGYGARWQRLSKRARDLQPFCSDCGSPYELTADHSVEAWRRVERGQSIRLQDVDVVCLTCNSERGAARGEQASDRWRQRTDEIDEQAARLRDDTDEPDTLGE